VFIWLADAIHGRSIKPGGWIEPQESDYESMCDDGTMRDDDAVKKMHTRTVEAFAKFDIDATILPGLEGILRDAGFEDIRHQTKKVPIRSRARDSKPKRIGFGEKPFHILGIISKENKAAQMLVQRALETPGYTDIPDTASGTPGSRNHGVFTPLHFGSAASRRASGPKQCLSCAGPRP